MRVRWGFAPGGLSAQATRVCAGVAGGFFFAPEFLLCALPQAQHLDVGTVSGSAGVRDAGRGAVVDPLGNAHAGCGPGGELDAGAAADLAALAGLVDADFGVDAALAGPCRSLHAGARSAAVSEQSAGRLCRSARARHTRRADRLAAAHALSLALDCAVCDRTGWCSLSSRRGCEWSS